jgi:hypothetical protein
VPFAFQEGCIVEHRLSISPFHVLPPSFANAYILCAADCGAPQERMYVLPVVIESVSLRQLGVEVHEMAGKKEIVLWSNC